MCSSLSKDEEVDVFVKHPKVLHFPKAKIRSSNTNVAATPNVDEVVDEAEDSSSESEFFYDEYSVSNDDDLYDNYVNANEEWVEVKSNGEKDSRVEEENIIVNDVGGEENLCDDDMRTLDSGSEKESNRDKPRYPQFVVDTDMVNPQFSVGLLFISATEFRVAMREYAIKNGRNVKFIKNEKDKVRVVCLAKCPWVVYATQHTCGRVFKNNNLTSRYLCKKYVDHFRNNPKLSIRAFMNTVRSSLPCEKKALKQIQRALIEQYAKLLDYCSEIKRTNPSSTVIMETKMVLDKGLVLAIEELLPNLKHRHCLRHL
ncbi:hypothetical protein PVL29_009656 [Vitis rotundifolia]|uniref:Transposase MuDR plant domain-containing protein n=1 Tax=Vitis rotundifolia TaxID=103349 RepID=A0AA38ZR69_VITRO|nr:hypothetical protein PVL29_009656 [Vitis rotundifolia]